MARGAAAGGVRFNNERLRDRCGFEAKVNRSSTHGPLAHCASSIDFVGLLVRARVQIAPSVYMHGRGVPSPASIVK
jgi:hypothetical protein